LDDLGDRSLEDVAGADLHRSFLSRVFFAGLIRTIGVVQALSWGAGPSLVIFIRIYRLAGFEPAGFQTRESLP
ncbi:hypothetical protein, partial [Mesorhizobium sp. M7A.F.Ca.CA.002.05.1.1]|uniref:hypothetical protein n=1 Tax=Mesorhizobium sp. M7A.F.Ca.CA.002.05.1.1 TaxID=2496704 RepID=UPI0019D0DECD